MALGDAVRKLLIELGIIGQAEVQAGIDSTTASVDKLAAKQTEVAVAGETASAAQVTALKNVEDALTRATSVSQTWAEASKAGGEGVKVAYQALVGSVGAVEGAIKKAQAAGAIVPQSSIDSLDKLKTVLTAATATLAPHAAAVGEVGKAHADTKLKVDLLRDAFGGWGRSIGAAAESSNAFVAAIGKIALAIAAPIAALVLFNKVAGELQQRGVDIATLGDLWGSVMDRLAISLGGTSKAMAGMIADMEKTQSAFANLDASQRAYVSGLDLMAAAQRPTTEQLRLFLSVAKEIPPELAALGGGLANAGVQARVALAEFIDFNTQLNAIRTTAPELAQALTEEFIAIQKLAQGSEEQTKALADWKERTTAAAKASEEFTATLKALYPTVKDVGTQYESFTQNIKRLEEGLKLARAAGLTEQQTMALLGPLVNSVGKGYDEFGKVLKIHNPTLAATAEAGHRLYQAFDPLQQKLKEMALAAAEQAKGFAGLLDGIDRAAKRTGDYVGALANEHAAIDADILSLEKQKATLQGLTPAQDALLKSLLALHAVLTPLTVEEERHNKIQADGLKAVHDLSKSYEDLTRAREKDKAAIETHRAAAVAALDAELAKALSGGQQTLAALKSQLDNQEIEYSDYVQAVNTLFAAEAEAKRRTVEAEDKLNEEAAKSEREHQKTYEEAAGEIAKSLEEHRKNLETAKADQAAYDVQVAESLAKVRGQWDETSKKVAEHGAEYPKLDIHLATFAEAVKTGTASASVAFDGLTAHIRECAKAIREVETASKAAFGGGGGSTAPPTEGGPDTFGESAGGE